MEYIIQEFHHELGQDYLLRAEGGHKKARVVIEVSRKSAVGRPAIQEFVGEIRTEFEAAQGLR